MQLRVVRYDWRHRWFNRRSSRRSHSWGLLRYDSVFWPGPRSSTWESWTLLKPALKESVTSYNFFLLIAWSLYVGLQCSILRGLRLLAAWLACACSRAGVGGSPKCPSIQFWKEGPRHRILIKDLTSYKLKYLSHGKKQGWFYSREYIYFLLPTFRTARPSFSRVLHTKKIPACISEQTRDFNVCRWKILVGLNCVQLCVFQR